MGLINDRKVAVDDRDAWSEHQPSTARKDDFIQTYGLAVYAKWHLGIDVPQGQNSKRRFEFPYGDFKKIHRCAVLSAESRAGQYKYSDIQRAAAYLHGILDESRHRKTA